MKLEVTQSGCGKDLKIIISECTRLHISAEFVCDEITAFLIQISCRCLILPLNISPHTQILQYSGQQRNASYGILRFGRLDNNLSRSLTGNGGLFCFVQPIQCPSDIHTSGDEINVFPPKSEKFTQSNARKKRQADKYTVSVSITAMHKTCLLISCKYLRLRLLPSRKIQSLCRIRLYVSLVYCKGQCLMFSSYSSNDVYNVKKVIFYGTSITKIGNRAFAECGNTLTRAIYCGTSTQWNTITIGNYNTSLTNVLYYHTYHSWSNKTTITASTCTGSGKCRETCSMCDLEQIVITPPLGHYCSSWTVTKPATCEGIGTKVGKCVRCDISMESSIDATGHSPSADWTYDTKKEFWYRKRVP